MWPDLILSSRVEPACYLQLGDTPFGDWYRAVTSLNAVVIKTSMHQRLPVQVQDSDNRKQQRNRVLLCISQTSFTGQQMDILGYTRTYRSQERLGNKSSSCIEEKLHL